MKKTNSKIFILSTVLLMVLSMVVFNAPQAEAKMEIFNVSVKTTFSEANINWYTSRTVLGELQYGENLGSLKNKLTKSVLSDWHSYSIQGLIPGTTYAYRLVAKDSNGLQLATQEGTFETLGTKPQSQVFSRYFYLSFNGNLYSTNSQYPAEILNPEGIKFGTPAVWKESLKITDANSHFTYSCDPFFNAGYATVMVWVRFDNFNKNMVIWESNDSRYALYFEHGTDYNRLVARAGYNFKNEDRQEARYYFNTAGTGGNIWKAGEWHQVAMTWEGKINGTVKIYIDGEARDSSNFTNGGGCTTFMVGNNYRHDMNWSNGQIDDFKMFDWNLDSTSVRNEYRNLAFIQKKDAIKTTGVVAGVSVQNFKIGKLIKNSDGKIYIIGRDNTKIHVSDVYALSKLGSKRVITEVTDEELAQYADGGVYYSWSRYPDGSMLKGSGKTVYWVWNGEKRPLASEAVFNRYGNDWNDLIVISDDELASYQTGFIYY